MQHNCYPGHVPSPGPCEGGNRDEADDEDGLAGGATPRQERGGAHRTYSSRSEG